MSPLPSHPYTSSYPPSSAAGTHHIVKPEPTPLQRQHLDSNSSSSLSSGYYSSGPSTVSTANTSDYTHADPSLGSMSGHGAAALLKQHQANQHAFRASPAPYFVYQNAAGPSSYDPRTVFETQSRESSAGSSTRGSESGITKQESDYDPFRIKHRRRTSPSQLRILEHHFNQNPKPDVATRKSLSEQLDMTPREVQVWFQNRRAKVKKLKERADREAATYPQDGNSPPEKKPGNKSPEHHSSLASELPIPPTVFPVSQPYPSRTIYGQDVISQRRTSPPAAPYGAHQYSVHSAQTQHGVPSMSNGQPHVLPSNDTLPHPYGHPGAYSSTVYTTTVASSTYATNEYLPAPPHSATHASPHYPLLAHDSYAERRFSLPVLAGSNGSSPWSTPTVPEPPLTSDGFPSYQPPTTSAFASSALATPAPPSSIGSSQPSLYPTMPHYGSPPATNVNGYPHIRRSSYGTDSYAYDSSYPTTTSSGSPSAYVSSSQVPVTVSAAAATDPFSSFDPLAAPAPVVSPRVISPADLLDESVVNGSDSNGASPGGAAGSRLVERRASVAHQHRQSNRLKPYDPNERRSPSSGGSHSPHSQH